VRRACGRGDHLLAECEQAAGLAAKAGAGAADYFARDGLEGRPIWSAGQQGGVRNAYRHFKNHGADFGARNALDRSLEPPRCVLQGMRRSIILSTLVIALGVVGCGEDDPAPSAASTATVSVADVGGTDVLADSSGKTLYTAAVEKDGKILCVEACASVWQPLLASSEEAETAAAELDADIGVVKRPDGEQQLTFDGLPLYTFAEEGAGKLDGDGFADDFDGTHFEWEAARTSGGGSSAPRGGYGY
jgi:predicted lipoprotein with Yx(FWY)xxD motif